MGEVREPTTSGPKSTPVWWGGLRGVWRDDLPDVVFGSACVGCLRPGRALCRACARPLTARPRRTRPDPEPPGLPPTWAITDYAGAVRAAIAAHKEHGNRTTAAALAAALARAVQAAAGDDAEAEPVLVVPVPSTLTAIRRRGDAPLNRLGRRALAVARSPSRPAGGGIGGSDGLTGPAPRLRWAPALRVVRRLADQAGLDARERAANLAGAFAVRAGPFGSASGASLDGRVVVLLDDVVTTGATLAEAARAVRSAGGLVRGAAVVAATGRRPDR